MLRMSKARESFEIKGSTVENLQMIQQKFDELGSSSTRKPSQLSGGSQLRMSNSALIGVVFNRKESGEPNHPL